MKPPRIVLVTGPTAVGKSSFALALAEQIAGEIVSVDSVQLYRHLDIGTAKPSAEARARVPHHLVDVLDPDEKSNVADFAEMAHAAIAEVHARGKPVVAVGGTNLYVRVLVRGIFDAPPPDEALRARHRAIADERGNEHLHAMLADVDPELAERIHPNDVVRVSRGLEVFDLTGKPLSVHQREHRFATPNYDALELALVRPREELYDRIDRRVDAMMEAGLLDEYRHLVDDLGYARDLDALQSLGYRHMGMHVFDGVDLDEAVRLMKRDTRRFAKQQLSWLRSEEGVRWARAPLVAGPEVVADVEAFLGGEHPALEWTHDTDGAACRHE